VEFLSVQSLSLFRDKIQASVLEEVWIVQFESCRNWGLNKHTTHTRILQYFAIVIKMNKALKCIGHWIFRLETGINFISYRDPLNGVWDVLIQTSQHACSKLSVRENYFYTLLQIPIRLYCDSNYFNSLQPLYAYSRLWNVPVVTQGTVLHTVASPCQTVRWQQEPKKLHNLSTPTVRQLCTILQVPVRLYSNSRNLRSFTTSLHL
jgi:hypothetical protein